MPRDELEWIRWLEERDNPKPWIERGIGDDMAIVRCGLGRVLIASDLLLDGVHFESKRYSPRAIGRKAAARSLSDCAAMAVRPLALTMSVALPRDLPLAAAKDLFEGARECVNECDAAIAGGDTARWENALALDVFVLAEPFPGVAPVTRAGARPKDRVYVTGPLGGSLLGRHMTFAPRLTEARRIAERLGSHLHAMIDISDGLSLDLWRICRASSAGAVLEEDLLQTVISEDARRAAATDGRPALEHALADGEDYELIVVASPDGDVTGLSLHPLGVMVEAGLQLRREDGSVAALLPQGYVH